MGLPKPYDWSGVKVPTKPFSNTVKNIEIDDETWRDGLQGTQLTKHPTPDKKYEYLKLASKYGFINHVDIGFPASSKKHLKEINYIISKVKEDNLPITLSCVARASVESDILPIIELSKTHNLPLEADIFLDVSTIRSQLHNWDRNKMLDYLKQNINLLKKSNLSVMFVPERATSTSPEELFEACDIALNEGADRICITDTQGLADSKIIENILRTFFYKYNKKYKNIKWDFHGHNDLGLALSNSITAALEGIDRIHATALCIGERSGNVDLAQLIVNLNKRNLRKDKLSNIQKFSDYSAQILGIKIPSNYPIIGINAYDTASGVHASAYNIENKIPYSIYFPFNPKDVGRKARIKVGPFSGAANVIGFANQLGLTVDKNQIEKVLNYAKNNLSIITENKFKKIIQK